MTLLHAMELDREMTSGPHGPGPAAVCSGQVLHRRSTPAKHQFLARVSFVWLDPDHPEDLCSRHPLWSSSRPAIARFDASDYGDGSDRSLAEQVRLAVAPVLQGRPAGEIRMLTQVRRWGWLFNPITLYVVWDEERPAALLLEVTNTPWKERTAYALALEDDGNGRFLGTTSKTLHVSPFLDEAYDYHIELFLPTPDRIELSIDVVPVSGQPTVLTTRLAVGRQPANRRTLTKALLVPIPTHRVSVGIHWQALRLALKGVPFVSHPKRRKP